MKRLLTSLAPLLVCLTTLTSIKAQDQKSNDTLSGIVMDRSSNPINNARIIICAVDDHIVSNEYCSTSHPDCKKTAKTNKDGRFVIKDLDTTKIFQFAVVAPGFRSHLSKSLKPGSEATINLKTESNDQDPGRFVSGVIFDEQGKPVVGARVSPHGAKTPEDTWTGRVEEVAGTATNALGQFSMQIPGNFQYLSIRVEAPGYCGVEAYELKPGDEPTEVVLPVGAQVSGRLVHDGQPVKGLQLAVVQTKRSSERGIFIAAVGCVTGEQGQFRFSHLPPDQKYCIYTVVDDKHDVVMTSKTFSVPASGETRNLGALQTVAPISIQGKVQRLSGKPLPKNFDLFFRRAPARQTPRFEVSADGTFHAKGLPPETYKITLRHFGGFEIVANKMKYQTLTNHSFGVYATESIKDLVITIQKEQK